MYREIENKRERERDVLDRKRERVVYDKEKRKKNKGNKHCWPEVHL